MNKLLVTGFSVLFCSTLALAHDHLKSDEHQADLDDTSAEVFDESLGTSSGDRTSSFGKTYEVHGAHITWGVGSPYFSQFNSYEELKAEELRNAE